MEEEQRDDSCLAVVTITGRGPIRIEGKFELVDTNGVRVFVNDDTVKICGCGRSATMPICDGAHKR